MAWLQAEQSLATNKKTLRLKNLLKVKKAEAIGMLMLLWWWALDNAPNGDLSPFEPEELAEVMEYSGRGKTPQSLITAMISAGFIDPDMRLHDWGDYTGQLVEQRASRREQNRIRQQRRREKQRLDGENDERDNNADVTRDTPVMSHENTPTTVHHSTVEYIYSGGGGGAGAREGELLEPVENCGEDAGEVLELMEDASQHKMTLAEIGALPPEVQSRFRAAIDHAYASYFGGSTPTEYDETTVFRLLRWLHSRKGKPAAAFTMSADDVFLLGKAFECAADAGKPSLSYIRGVFKKFRERGIRSEDKFWAYEYHRKEAGGKGGGQA